ncbi:MAG: flocculation-associated PEP-CTERM protein PepA [Gammaproteobacteria bacterium]|nr:flocculation-associated PEP-CTERM protein PepA [Gammaproteobacteria bacterium]
MAAHQLGGATQLAANLNTIGSGAGYELTLVAQFSEEITAVSAFNFTSKMTGGSALLFFDTTPDHSFLTDSGFNDGDLLLTGTIGSGGAVSVPSLFAGFAQIDVQVSSLNPAVFTPKINGVNGVFTLDLRSTAVNGVSSVGGHFPGTGGLILGSDGALTLRAAPTPIPLPAAAWLLGSALSVVPILRRRRVPRAPATR